MFRRRRRPAKESNGETEKRTTLTDVQRHPSIISTPTIGAYRANPDLRAQAERRSQQTQERKDNADRNMKGYNRAKWDLLGELKGVVDRANISNFQTRMVDSSNNHPEDSALSQLTPEQLTQRKNIVYEGFKRLGDLSKASGWTIPAGKTEAVRLTAAYDAATSPEEGKMAVDKEISSIAEGK